MGILDYTLSKLAAKNRAAELELQARQERAARDRANLTAILGTVPELTKQVGGIYEAGQAKQRGDVLERAAAALMTDEDLLEEGKPLEPPELPEVAEAIIPSAAAPMRAQPKALAPTAESAPIMQVPGLTGLGPLLSPAVLRNLPQAAPKAPVPMPESGVAATTGRAEQEAIAPKEPSPVAVAPEEPEPLPEDGIELLPDEAAPAGPTGPSYEDILLGAQANVGAKKAYKLSPTEIAMKAVEIAAPKSYSEADKQQLAAKLTLKVVELRKQSEDEAKKDVLANVMASLKAAQTAAAQAKTGVKKEKLPGSERLIGQLTDQVATVKKLDEFAGYVNKHKDKIQIDKATYYANRLADTYAGTTVGYWQSLSGGVGPANLGAGSGYQKAQGAQDELMRLIRNDKALNPETREYLRKSKELAQDVAVSKIKGVPSDTDMRLAMAAFFDPFSPSESLGIGFDAIRRGLVSSARDSYASQSQLRNLGTELRDDINSLIKNPTTIKIGPKIEITEKTGERGPYTLSSEELAEQAKRGAAMTGEVVKDVIGAAVKGVPGITPEIKPPEAWEQSYYDLGQLWELGSTAGFFTQEGLKQKEKILQDLGVTSVPKAEAPRGRRGPHLVVPPDVPSLEKRERRQEPPDVFEGPEWELALKLTPKLKRLRPYVKPEHHPMLDEAIRLSEQGNITGAMAIMRAAILEGQSGGGL
ncbi:MAG TPA: hypothetical protein VJ327_11280 [Patescibacteria group bacterium]|nr:hypothetical protein [Patescibacteria group bacterium]